MDEFLNNHATMWGLSFVQEGDLIVRERQKTGKINYCFRQITES